MHTHTHTQAQLNTPHTNIVVKINNAQKLRTDQSQITYTQAFTPHQYVYIVETINAMRVPVRVSLEKMREENTQGQQSLYKMSTRGKIITLQLGGHIACSPTAQRTEAGSTNACKYACEEVTSAKNNYSTTKKVNAEGIGSFTCRTFRGMRSIWRGRREKEGAGLFRTWDWGPCMVLLLLLPAQPVAYSQRLSY